VKTSNNTTDITQGETDCARCPSAWLQIVPLRTPAVLIADSGCGSGGGGGALWMQLNLAKEEGHHARTGRGKRTPSLRARKLWRKRSRLRASSVRSVWAATKSANCAHKTKHRDA
jgi:hypothetical protein